MQVHVTIVYHEDYDELLAEIKKWDTLFSENSDLIFPGKDFKDIEKANSEKKTAIFFGFQNCSPIEDDISLGRKSSQSRMQIYASLLIIISHC
jgi:microsomal dipeptidase-like Zn-dependent dipeptidase